MEQYLTRINDARVTISELRGQFAVEITVETSRHVFRSERRDAELLTAFDEASAAVEKQARRHKRRVRDRTKTGRRKLAAEPPQVEQPAAEDDEDQPEDYEFQIVRTKRHVTHPMTPGEAVMYMEEVGHDFFVFVNSSTREPSAVYRRRTGGYGLIELQVEQHEHGELEG
jgi:putative sigma-54 modulation protein